VVIRAQVRQSERLLRELEAHRIAPTLIVECHDGMRASAQRNFFISLQSTIS
jgi:hypothetical protein